MENQKQSQAETEAGMEKNSIAVPIQTVLDEADSNRIRCWRRNAELEAATPDEG